MPVTVLNPAVRQAPTDVPSHPTYNGVVLFRNTFDGQLPATDYPKVNVSRKRGLLPSLSSQHSVLPRHVPCICHRRLCVGMALL